jgi:S1-C subfamily serine protease
MGSFKTLTVITALSCVGLAQQQVSLQPPLPRASTVAVERSMPEIVVNHSVTILSLDKEGKKRGLGSGVIYVKNGITYCLTAAHVIGSGDGTYYARHENAESGANTFWRGYPCVIEPDTDWAILRLEGDCNGSSMAATFDYGSLRRGQDMLVAASPLGENNMVTEGIVAHNSRSVAWNQDLHLVVTCDGAFGSSGGGVYDAKTGKCVGIVVRMCGVSGLLYAVPMNTILKDLALLGQTDLLPT